MRKHFFVKAILALAAIGLLVGGLRGAFRTGWWQGYLAGQASESGEEGATPYWGPRMAPRAGLAPHWGFRPIGFLRPFLTFVLLLFLFGLALKAFGFWVWARKGGGDWRKAWPHGHPPHGHPPSGHPPSGRHWPHGPMPPWCWGDTESSSPEAPEDEAGDQAPGEEQVAKVKPEN